MNEDGAISYTTLIWDETERSPASPRSAFFNDIYFSGDGPAEASHVFIDGNDLATRFPNAVDFAIAELGFGSGLNFLAAADFWRRMATAPKARLDYFSIEKHPLAPADLARMHRAWPQFADLSAALIDVYPPPVKGFHRLEIDRSISLTLYYGDALEGLAACEGEFDAWFFDGFAPAANPEMWREEIMRQAARHSRRGATFATFTVAGAVRRALTAAGFTLGRRPGFGRKREMLVGRLAKPIDDTGRMRSPWFDTKSASAMKPGARIGVIGAGIAGASLARALARHGYSPTIFEQDQAASGASGNAVGLIMPRLDASDTPAAEFFITAYLYVLRLIAQLQNETGDEFFHACGVTLHGRDEKTRARFEKLLTAKALPGDWMKFTEEALFFPQAGVISPPCFVKALLGDAPIRRAKITGVKRSDDQWRLRSANGHEEVFDGVVIANGFGAIDFDALAPLALAGSPGQIDIFAEARAPKSAHAFGPYCAPLDEGAFGLAIGATYASIDAGGRAVASREATDANIEAIGEVFPELAAELVKEKSAPRASIRCVTPDRLPVAGPIPNWAYYGRAYEGLSRGERRDYAPGAIEPGLFVLTGLGSRGLVTAPILAAMIAAEIAGAPSPLSARVAEALHPARFFIRAAKRR